ncbi:hypothetical protein L9F63_014519, partial [Diploptera punctata]
PSNVGLRPISRPKDNKELERDSKTCAARISTRYSAPFIAWQHSSKPEGQTEDKRTVRVSVIYL